MLILYLRDHKKTIIFFIISVIIFSVILKLYHIPFDAAGYAALLCAALALIFFAYDYYNYRKRNLELRSRLDTITGTLQDLPLPKTLTEENWAALLEKTYENDLKNRNKSTTVMSEMMDYYTMWVHQVKTPIAAMRLLLQTSEKNVTPELKKELYNELFKTEQYIDMVLSYMRLESPTTDYVIKEYDLDVIIRRTIKNYSILFINKKLSLNYTATRLKVLTDEKWLAFAIEQILSNALKYTDKGEITIKRDTAADDKSVIIEDTGIGIASEDIPRVFDKGYTGYNGRSEKRSTGIGLFLTKKILSQLGHSIKIESTPGIGTKVYLELNDANIVHE